MWHRRSWAGPALRAAGGLSILLAAAAGHRLLEGGAAGGGSAPGAGAYLAIFAFACASGGSAALFWGAHLFDQVPVSARWRRLTVERNPAARVAAIPLAERETRAGAR